jgi:hypothetical protein
MSVRGREDIYDQVTICGEQEFELAGPNTVVPLQFAADASFIMRAILMHEGEFTAREITTMPGFSEVCEDTYPMHRFVRLFSDLRFTLDALGSTLIRLKTRDGSKNIYARDPRYIVVDHRDPKRRNRIG